MAAFLSPIGNSGAPFFTQQGVVLAGGLIYTYLAGTTTPAATWTTSAQGVQNANPIVLNSAGLPPQEIWLQQGTTYKFVIQDAQGNTLQTLDNISGINDVVTSSSEWVPSNLVPTYISATQFSVPGNQLLTFQFGRRVKAAISAGTVYGFISNVVFTSVTTVTVFLDSGALDAGLASVSVGLLGSANHSIPSPSSNLMFGGVGDPAGISTGNLPANASDIAIGFQVSGAPSFLAVANASNAANIYCSKSSGYLNSNFMQFYVTNSLVGSIATNGSSTSFNTSSDYRLKENVIPLSDAVSRISSLSPYRFNFKGYTHVVDGFLAHEVQKVVPEAVQGHKDAVDDDGEPLYQSIDHSKLVPLLVAAIQELNDRLVQLEKRGIKNGQRGIGKRR